MAKLDINEIFKSIDGEGIYTGIATTFVRLNGCNLRCDYCDTEYALRPGHNMIEIDKILDEIRNNNTNHVTITGGEPLLDDNLIELIDNLKDKTINIETNGSVDIEPFNRDNVTFTVDIKVPSSGEVGTFNNKNFHHLKKTDVVKFVVGTHEDLQFAKETILNNKMPDHVYFSPIFGKIEPREIVEYILENNLSNVRLGLQIHKIVWDPNERGV